MKLKFITAKRIKQVYYEVKYSFETQSPYRIYMVKKMACLCFIGVPYRVISEIYVPHHPLDLE